MQVQLHGVLQLRQRGLTAGHAWFGMNGNGGFHHLLHDDSGSMHLFA